MAKKNNGTTTTAEPQSNGKVAPPQGYAKQSLDPIGMWDGKGAIHFIPRRVKMFDGNIEKNKPSILVIAQLLDVASLLVKNDDTGEFETAQGNRGDVIGIWYKPGMKDLTQLCDAKVWMTFDGERNTGKPNPMKMFDIRSPGPSKRVFCTSDERK
jgi:hypothetical protein